MLFTKANLKAVHRLLSETVPKLLSLKKVLANSGMLNLETDTTKSRESVLRIDIIMHQKELKEPLSLSVDNTVQPFQSLVSVNGMMLLARSQSLEQTSS